MDAPRRRAFVLLAPAIVAAGCVFAVRAPVPPRPGPDEHIADFLRRRHAAGDYLSTLEALLDTSSSLSPQTREAMLAWEWGKAGDYAQVDLASDDPITPYLLESSEQALVEAIDPVPAAAGLCAAAHGRKLVMINEEHPWPVDRAFGATVLPCLRADGFDSLAVEMLTTDATPVRAGGVPRDYRGNFADEPRMSGLLSSAVALGFRLVPYEHYSHAPAPEDRWNEREQGQADAIVAFLAAHPDSRLVVWCGFDHVHERDDEPDPRYRSLGARLKAATGIDPLTVAQIAGRVHDEYAGPLFTAVNHRRRAAGPLYVDLESHWSRIPSSFRAPLASLAPGAPPLVDAVVIHESRRAGDARHLWLEAPADQAHPARVVCDARRHRLGLLVQLFRDRAAAARDVPYDQTLCPCNGACELVAPPGRWFVVVRDESAPALQTFETLGPDPLVLRPDHE